MGVFSVPPGRGVRGDRFNHFRFGRLVDEFLNATPQDEPHRIGVMEAPRPHHLRVVDSETGEVRGDCPDCRSLELELRGKRGQITRLKNELAQLREVSPERDDVIFVLEAHRELLMPGAKISERSARWGVVEALLKLRDDESGGRLFTALELKAAVVGMSLQPFIKENRWARDLTWGFTSQPVAAKPGAKPGPRFPDPSQVERHMRFAVEFKRRTGTSALTLLDELGGGALWWLAERCECGHLRAEHAVHGPTRDLRLPCDVEGCGCADMDWLSAKIDRFMREQTGGVDGVVVEGGGQDSG